MGQDVLVIKHSTRKRRGGRKGKETERPYMKPFLTIYMWKGTLEDICDLYVRRKRVWKGKMLDVRGSLSSRGGSETDCAERPNKKTGNGHLETEFASAFISFSSV